MGVTLTFMKMNAPEPSALENNSLHFFFGGGVVKVPLIKASVV